MAFQKRALAYYRTSSASGVGEEKDTLPRQQEAVRKYALRESIQVVKEYYDDGVSGTIAVGLRPEFKKLVDYAMANSIDLILVETANRFARDVMVQLMGHEDLKKAGISLIPVDAPNHFLDETPTAEMLRIIIAAVSQYEKKSLVKKMGDARARKREKDGRCEGRTPPPPEAIAMAKSLRLDGLSYREIGERLGTAGFRVIEKKKVTDRIYKPQSVKNMIEMEESA